jgi:tetratricopeptide (TPR) repeat protein
MIVAASMATTSPLIAAEATELKIAAQPLSQGVPEVAIVRLRKLLNNAPSLPEKRAVAAELAAALVEAQQFDEALKVLAAPELQNIPSTELLRAQALAGLQRWPEALPIYTRIAADDRSSSRVEALFGAAEALRALHQSEDALQSLVRLFGDKQWGVRARMRAIELLIEKRDLPGATRLLDEIKPESRTERTEKRFLRGCLDAAQNQHEKASAAFHSVAKNPEGVTHPVLIATLVALADVHLRLKTPEAGDDALEDFIEHHPSDRSLPLVFAKLDELYRAERKASRNELGRWRRDPLQPRQALAQWYFARGELRSGRRDNAVAAFLELRETGVKVPEAAEGLLEFAQLEIEEHEFAEASATLEKARASTTDTALVARINQLAGETQYRAGKFDEAARLFREEAHTHAEYTPIALYNAALCALRLGNRAQFLVDSNELNTGSGPEAGIDLLLEEGLLQAAQGQKGAADTLQKFCQQAPTHKRVSEAWVALAELEFHRTPPRISETRKNLARALQSDPTPVARERADYLAIWIEDAAPSGNAMQIVQLANEFLQKHSGSRFAAEVRMKLGELYFRRQDFANAQTHFEILAREHPTEPLAEKALFFAAQAAMSSMGPDSLDRAIVLLDEVVRKDGELKWAARNEQAAIERKLGKAQDALLLYDEVVKSSTKPVEKREALCGRGDIYAETASTNPDDYHRAIAMFDQLASEPDISPHWRNQALFKKGICLEKLNDPEGALATYYTAIEETGRPDRQREFFWFYKAGFSAARLLEQGEKWQSASAIYQKLATAGGARSDEAKTRLTRLRLEHFLWD